MLCTFTVLIIDSVHVQLAVKYFLPCQFCLLRFLWAIHLLIWIYTFAPHKLENIVPCAILSDVFTLVIIQVQSQFIQALCNKPATIHEPWQNILTYFFTNFVGCPSQADVDLEIQISSFLKFFSSYLINILAL